MTPLAKAREALEDANETIFNASTDLQTISPTKLAEDPTILDGIIRELDRVATTTRRALRLIDGLPRKGSKT